MSATEGKIRGPKTIFRWEVQIPFGLACVGAYFYFASSEGRKEPVLVGIGYGALAAGIFEFFMRRKSRREAIQPAETTRGK